MRILGPSFLAVLFAAAVSEAKDFNVDSAKDIRAAMTAAQAGDTISIKPGEYDMGQALVTGNSGTRDKPIVMRAAGERGYAKLKITGAGSDVGFRVNSRFWVLRGLHIEGGNKAILDLIQISAPAGGGDLTMVDCKVSKCGEFLIKASRSREKAPDNVILDHCEWFDCPETAIDLVSGDNWIIRGNYVHDYGTDGKTHYGMFLKGGGKNGVIEGNFVDGKAGKGGSIGISFGGGLTGKQWLPLAADGKAAPEHTGGICRNNIVVYTGDCAYHSNNASDCKFCNNLAFNCGAGFQRQGSYAPDPVLTNNVLSGNLKGPGKTENNLTKVDKSWFVAPDQFDFRLTEAGKAALAGKGLAEKALADNPTDFFGSPRKAGAAQDLGPVNAGAKESTRWVDRRAAGVPAPDPKASSASQPSAAPAPKLPTAAKPTAAPAQPDKVAAAPASQPTSSPALLDKIKTAPANTWIEVPKSPLMAVAPKPDQFPKTWSVCGPASVVMAWCGAAYDSKRERLVIWGGGHADYHGNELYAFDVKKLAWERLTDPFPTPVNDEEVNADGTPNSRHTYGGLAYLVHADRFFGLGGSLAGKGFAKCDRTWTYDFDARKWEDRQPGGKLPGGGFCLGCAYDPGSKKLYFGSEHNGLFAYDYDKNTWAKLDDQPANALGFAVDTKRKLLVGAGGGRLVAYDIGNSNFKQQVLKIAGGDHILQTSNAAGLDYDPVADRLVGWASWAPEKVYTLDLGAKKWEVKETQDAPKAAKNARNGVFGRWRYVPGVNAFIAVSDAYANVFFYKQTAGDGKAAKDK